MLAAAALASLPWRASPFLLLLPRLALADPARVLPWFSIVQEGFSLTAPLVFFYGHTGLNENPELFKKLVVSVPSSMVIHR